MSNNEYKSPWSHRASEFKQAALRCRDVRDEIGREMREFQQESYELYEQWHQHELYSVPGAALAANQEDTARSTDRAVQGFVAAIKQRLEIFMEGFSPAPLASTASAGTPKLFPQEQQLPSEWFGGRSVVLQFKHDPSGAWYVIRQGSSAALFLQLWSNQGRPIGPTLRVGGTQARLPLDLNGLARIEVRLADEHEP